MCLEKAKIVTLDEDKVVYKVFIKTNDGKLMTLYQGKFYELSDEPIHDVLIHDESDNVYVYVYDDDEKTGYRMNVNGHIIKAYKTDDGYKVYAGMFHSFANYEDAVYEADRQDLYWFYGEDAECVVVKCIIPKNAQLVMEGVFQHSCEITYCISYASSDIIFKEIVK